MVILILISQCGWYNEKKNKAMKTSQCKWKKLFFMSNYGVTSVFPVYKYCFTLNIRLFTIMLRTYSTMLPRPQCDISLYQLCRAWPRFPHLRSYLGNTSLWLGIIITFLSCCNTEMQWSKQEPWHPTPSHCADTGSNCRCVFMLVINAKLDATNTPF